VALLYVPRAFVVCSCTTHVEEPAASKTPSPQPANDNQMEQAYNSNWYKEIIMDDVNSGQISNQLGQIVAQLAAIREVLEKLAAQNDHPTYSQSKRY
jgi:hypothetical protein